MRPSLFTALLAALTGLVAAAPPAAPTAAAAVEPAAGPPGPAESFATSGRSSAPPTAPSKTQSNASGHAEASSSSSSAAHARPVLTLNMRSATYWDRLTYTCLQGIANRKRPQIYLEFGNSDRDWMQMYHKRYGVKTLRLKNPTQVFKARNWPIKGYVIVDLQVPDTANLAATYASTRNLLPVTAPFLHAHRDALPDLPIKEDLRGRFREKSRTQIYQWSAEHQWPQANHRIVAGLNMPPAAVNISSHTASHDTLYLRFDHKAKLYALEVIKNHRSLMRLNVGVGNEKQQVIRQQGTHVNGHRREAGENGSWVYKISGVKGADHLLLDVLQEYRLGLATKPGGPFKTISQGPPGHFSNVGRSNKIRDYVIARHGFFWRLSSDPKASAQYALKQRLLEQMPPLGYVMGWHGSTVRGGEPHLVRQVSRAGKIVIASSLAPNFSLHRRIQAKKPLKLPHKKPDDVKLAEDKIYVNFAYSDGDSLNHVSRFLLGYQWPKQQRGEVPFTWEIQPLLTDMAPAVVEYLYHTATPNDFFTASGSGLGYAYPGEMSDQQLSQYLRATGGYLKKMDLHTIEVLSHKPLSEHVAKTYQKVLGEQVLGIYEAYLRHGSPFRVLDALTEIPAAIKPHKTPDQFVRALRKIASDHKQRPLFVHIHVVKGQSKYADVVKIVNQLDPEVFKVVGPEEMSIAYREAAQTVPHFDPGVVIPEKYQGVPAPDAAEPAP